LILNIRVAVFGTRQGRLRVLSRRACAAGLGEMCVLSRDIDKVMRLIIEAESLNDSLMRDVNTLLQGLSHIERLNVINVAMQSWRRRRSAGEPVRT